jgi:beta-lactam-binding protein with PASTA domain
MTQIVLPSRATDPVALCLDIADGSADATYYMVAPFAGDISKIYTVIDGAVSTADITITAKIGATGITNGVVTITSSASAAGDVDSATPSAAKTVTAGQAINLVVAGGGSGGSPKIHVVVLLTRS